MDIYLDTMLWNALCDQRVPPDSLVKALEDRGNRLILGDHNVFEIAKILHEPSGQGIVRGKELFTYLKHFMNQGVPYLKDIGELLPAEMWSIQNGIRPVEKFYNAAEYASARASVASFATGALTDDANAYVEERKQTSRSAREAQKLLLTNDPAMRDTLRAMSREQLPVWLDNEVRGNTGFLSLTGHIGRRFPEVPTLELMEYARILLRTPNGRISRAIVRADLYYGWRCAHRGSNPRDLLDDMYHVMSSTHCDVYGTQEVKQAEYAELLFGEGTQIAIYQGSDSIDEWLRALSQDKNDS